MDLSLYKEDCIHTGILTNNIVMNIFIKHVSVAVLAAVIAVPFWYGRLDWDPEMRVWRTVGDASVVLLFLVLFLGPLARLFKSLSRFLHWRRELGIWFGVLALVHTLLVLDGWVRWDWMRFFGYEFIAQFDRYARIESGFGLSNLIGIIAVLITIPLMLTSSNWAMARLGGSSWKWLHYGSYTVFYLVALHTLYFLFVHYTESYHRPVPPNLNWFRYPFLFTTLLLLAVQGSAFFAFIGKRSARRVKK